MAYSFDDLVRVMETLRSENGCPWDKKQDMHSMRKYVLEEAYEVVQAIDDEDSKELCEELGDLLFQIVFQAQLGKEKNDFDINDVANGICTKMVKRHPHIFGQTDSEGNIVKPDSEKVLNNWEVSKKIEKGFKTNTDVLNAVPRALPPMMRAEKILYKAETSGFDVAKTDKSYADFDVLGDEIKGLEGLEKNEVEEKIGEILLKLVSVSRKLQINADFSLTKATEKFINKFKSIESSADEDGLQLQEMTTEQKCVLWNRSKAAD